MLKKLRIKFVCINMVIATVMLGVVLGMVLKFTYSNLEIQSIQQLQSIAAEPMHNGRPGGGPDRVQLPYFTLLINKNGGIDAIGGDNYDLSDQEFLKMLLDTAMQTRENTGYIPEHDLRFMKVGTPMGQHIVFADVSSEVSTMENLVRTCVIIGVVGFLAFLLISALLARWTIKPVEQAWNQQRQFVADASHELKTPLTVITTNAELLQSEDCGEEERRQFSENILTMSRQMRGLTEGLLELARVDNGSVNTAFSQVDLSRLVENSVLPFEAVYFEKGLGLECGIDPGIRCSGDESHLRQVVEILLDNAQKYSHSHTVVTVSLRKSGRGECLLTVSNRGDTIASDDLKNIFKRFYRVDAARSMNHSYGLGLSIAEGIVQAHKGKIWAESREGMNTFFVRLPTM